MFYEPTHKMLYKEILACKSKNGSTELWLVCQHLTDIAKINEVGGPITLTNYTKYAPLDGQIMNYAQILVQKHIQRQADTIASKIHDRIHSGDDIADIIDDSRNDLQALLPDDRNIEAHKIDPLSDLTEPPVCCSINGCPSMTGGNFSLLNGKAKSGKTFFLGSVIASMLNNSQQLSVIKGSLPHDKRNVLYFDTEQSSYHANRTIKRICSLIGDPNPSNLIAYSLRPFTPAERLTFIEQKISKTPDLGTVAIDGVRDLLSIGINDEAEATSLTSKFLKWTSDYNIHLILLLHQNKGDLNARGHIGTECLNKAETTISISKDKSNIFIVSCEYSRDISFGDFGFVIEDGLPAAADIPTEGQTKVINPQNIAADKHQHTLDLIYKETRKLSGADLQAAIQYHFHVGIIKSRDYVYHYILNNWIKKEREGKNVYYTYNRAIF